jgi:secondary thiamine-phosphate synthase enzyme
MAQRITVRSGAREQLLDITAQVARLVELSGVEHGVLHLWSLHTTCALTVNEGFDPDVAADMVRFMAALVPPSGRIETDKPASDGFRHAEGNSDAHLKTAFFGPGLTLLIEDGELLLGRWQKIFLAEWDGPRDREIAAVIQEGANGSAW